MESNFKILDCTLRDGGYRNNWEFSDSFAEESISRSSSSAVEYIEVGFIGFHNPSSFYGRYARVKNSLFHKLELSKFDSSPKFGVMMNAGDYELNHLKGLATKVSEFDFVRIATRLADIKNAVLQAEAFHDFGFVCFLNIMQAHTLSSREVTQIVDTFNNSPFIEGLYFADTMGSMVPRQVNELFTLSRTSTKKTLGFHAHDNMGLAVANSMAAGTFENVVLDGTWGGLGRGIGNARLESLISSRNLSKSNSEISLTLEKLSLEMGESELASAQQALYFASGATGTHPNYVEQISADNPSSCESGLKVFAHFEESDKGTFDSSNADLSRLWFSEAYEGVQGNVGPEIPETVTVLAPGPNLQKHKSDVAEFLAENPMHVGSLFFESYLTGLEADLFFVSNPLRALSLTNSDCREKMLVAPWAVFERKGIEAFFETGGRVDYGIEWTAGAPSILPNMVRMRGGRVSLFAIAFYISQGVKKIHLAGFDGYRDGHARNIEFENFLRSAKVSNPNLQVESITPTSYALPYSEV